MTRHFLEVDDVSSEELDEVLGLAELSPPPPALSGRGVALLFEKPSNRTRNSCEIAVFQLGGHPVTIRGEDVGMGTREAIEDVARTLGCYHAVLGARVNDHSSLEGLAAALDRESMAVPVVNLLSDLGHPCQALADLLTLKERLGSLRGRTLTYVGDSNNVLRSLGLACAMADVTVKVASPPGFEPDDSYLSRVGDLGGEMQVFEDPAEAVRGADAVYTDVWVSMGQEEQAGSRKQAFSGYTVDERLMDLAAPHAAVLHCLPVHRGEEVSAEVVDGPRSAVWQQAANRMHSMRGLLLWLMGAGP